MACQKASEEAAEHFGWFAHFAAMDNPASSQANLGTARLAAEAAWAYSQSRRAALFRNKVRNSKSEMLSSNHTQAKSPKLIPRIGEKNTMTKQRKLGGAFTLPSNSISLY